MKTKEQLVWDSFSDEYKKDLKRDAKAAAYYERLFRKGYKFCKHCGGAGVYYYFARLKEPADIEGIELEAGSKILVKDLCTCTRWTWWEVILHFIRSRCGRLSA